MNEREQKQLEKLLEKQKQEKKEQAKKKREFDKKCVEVFGMKSSEILTRLDSTNATNSMSEFEKAVRRFYHLNTHDDCQRFIELMLNENSLSFWNGRK